MLKDKPIIGNKTGKLGEDIAEMYLKGKGFEILHKNYWKPYGEIDIVAKKANRLHFVEVKAVSRENYNAAENVHPWKLKKLGRVIQSFLMLKAYKDMDWQFDICVVQIDMESKKARVKLIDNELLPE
ncbi:MAG: YraN family protein [Patescibacteria group bacterium]